MHDPLAAYEACMRSFYDTERRIANITQWGQPHPDSVNARILPSLLARRDREALALIELKAAANIAPERARAATSHIHFPKGEWMPAGSIRHSDRIGDIPTSLRRART